MRKTLVTGMAAMMLIVGFAPAASAHGKHRKHHRDVAIGGEGGDGGLIGLGIGLCILADCDDVGSDNGSGGDGGDAIIEDD